LKVAKNRTYGFFKQKAPDSRKKSSRYQNSSKGGRKTGPKDGKRSVYGIL
jgi:hypothetical protein